jgi:hypothetical protein
MDTSNSGQVRVSCTFWSERRMMVVGGEVVANYRDNLFDVCWSETDPQLVTTAAGDGWIQMWNLDSSNQHALPRVPHTTRLGA